METRTASTLASHAAGDRVGTGAALGADKSERAIDKLMNLDKLASASMLMAELVP